MNQNKLISTKLLKLRQLAQKNRKHYEWNARENNAILCALGNVEFTKLMQFTTVKIFQEKLKSTYESDEKVNKAKVQTFFTQFETLKMKGEEIATCFLRVDEIVNSIAGLGETVEEKTIVQKNMRTLPICFSPKV